MVPDHVWDAARNGNLDTLRAYFESGDKNPDDINERTNLTLLEAAAWGSPDEIISCEVLAFLIQQGAQVNYREPGGQYHNPLAMAATGIDNRGSRFEAVKLLVEAGADINTGEMGPGIKAGFAPVLVAAIKHDMRLFKYLMNHGADLDSGLAERRSAAALSGNMATGNETIEAWLNQVAGDRYGSHRGGMLKMVADIRAAGGTVQGYLWEPRRELCMLRILCEQGRATPLIGVREDQIGHRSFTRMRTITPEERTFLERLFAWSPPYSTDSRRRTRSSQAAVRASHSPLPRDVFKLVISFWMPGVLSREWYWRSNLDYHHY